MSKQLPKSDFIVRHGDNHETFYGTFSPVNNFGRLCLLITVPGPARSLEFEFLTTGKLPSTTIEIYYPPSGTRGPNPDPYSDPVGPLAGDIYSR